MILTLEIGRRLIDSAKRRAAELGIRVAIVVVDPSGNLLSLDRMDGTRLMREEFARAKAFAAVFFGRPSKDSAQLRESNPSLFHNALAVLQGRAMLVGGGVPIVTGGQIIGGIGVSGGTDVQDHEVASGSVAEVVAALQ